NGRRSNRVRFGSTLGVYEHKLVHYGKVPGHTVFGISYNVLPPGFWVQSHELIAERLDKGRGVAVSVKRGVSQSCGRPSGVQQSSLLEMVESRLHLVKMRVQCRRERAPKPYKRDSSGVAPASPRVAYRALLERCIGRPPKKVGRIFGPTDNG